VTTTISLLTPLDPARSGWLEDLAADVEALRLRLTGEVEWVVCLDGPGAVDLPAAVSVTVRLPIHGGIATARTAALTAASGDWVIPVDGDDRLDLDGTASLAAELTSAATADLGWLAASRVLMDGTPTPHTLGVRRRWEVGELAEAWTAPFPFHPNTLAVRRPLAVGAGGWPALPVNEDLAFILAVSEDSPGLSVEHVLTRYRSWEGQTVSSPAYAEAKRVAFDTISALHNARRARASRAPIAPPQAAGGAHGISAR
jgi:hypothetical protein